MDERKNDASMTLATELLHELKASCKRWFIAFCIMVGVEVATIAGFLWYISLPVEEYSISQDADDIDNSTINQSIGGKDHGESKTDSDVQEESSPE